MLRIVLLFSASFMALLIGLQFLGDPSPNRPFENMNVVLIYGSESRGGLHRIIDGACEAAELALGCSVVPVGIEWSDTALLDEFRRQSSILPSGICLMGYPGSDIVLSEMEDLRELEVPMTTYNSRFPAAEERYSADGFGFVGIDEYEAGYQLVRAAIEKHALQPGDPAMLLGDLDHPARANFRDGCLKAFAEGEIEVERTILSSAELERGPEAAAAALAERNKAGTLPKLLCMTEFPIGLGVDLLDLAKIRSGDLPLIGLGISPRYDENNYGGGASSRHVSLVASQDLALQAYLAIVQVCLRRTAGSTGLHINTPFEIIGMEGNSTAPLRSNDTRTVQVY